MVLPISTWPPSEPNVAVGVLLSLLSAPQPARPMAATAAVTAIKTRVRMVPRFRWVRKQRGRSRGNAVDPVRHAQLSSAIPDHRVAVLIEDGLVGAVNSDVVDHVVGHNGVRRALHRHGPAGAERVDGVARAEDDQRRLVAVDRLVAADRGDVSVAVLGLRGGHAHGQLDKHCDREGDHRSAQRFPTPSGHGCTAYVVSVVDGSTWPVQLGPELRRTSRGAALRWVACPSMRWPVKAVAIAAVTAVLTAAGCGETINGTPQRARPRGP